MGKIKDMLKPSQQKMIIAGILCATVGFLLVSLSTFYAVRLALPMITYFGRTSLYTLPSFFTYIVPLLIFYFLCVIIFTKTSNTRIVFMRILGILLLFISIFDLAAISFAIVFIFEGQLFIKNMTPMFCLDIIVFNCLYLLSSIIILIYAYLDKKYTLTKYTLKYVFSKKDTILATILLPFGAYFVGECLYGIKFLFDGFIDQKIGLIIPHYLSFALFGIMCGIYVGYKFIDDKKRRLKFQTNSLIALFSINLIIYSWLIIGYIVDPYVVATSLQWEYEIGLAIKMPIGIIVVGLLNIIPCFVCLFNLIYKKKVFNKGLYEQE